MRLVSSQWLLAGAIHSNTCDQLGATGQAITSRMSQKRVAIVQSSYIPWKGYFDLIRACDEFILLDDVQFTRRDWRSRNRIKTKDGLAWLTIPVRNKGRYLQTIQDVTVSDSGWGARHWRTIHESYARSPFFDVYEPILEPFFRHPVSDRLSQINYAFITTICEILGIGTRISWSTDYDARPGRNERLVDLCRQTAATHYLSGPSARTYLDLGAFTAASVTVRFVDYSGYPEYPQPYPPFEHGVSILDLLFCTGPRAHDYLRDLCRSRSAA